MSTPHLVAGVDGCPRGWIAALLSDDDAVSWRRLTTSAEVVGLLDLEGLTHVGVDAVIGLPATDPREADLRARTLLGPRRASVFPAPPRATLAATSYEEACALARGASARAISLQTWHVLDRIRSLDAALRTSPPEIHTRLTEVHPELSFHLLATSSAHHVPPLPPKRTAEGRRIRHELLQNCTPAPLPRGVPEIDALDALAVAHSVRRWRDGAACVLGGELDELGLPMRIVY